FRIAHMAMDDRGTGLGRLDRRLGDLFRRDRHMFGSCGGLACPGHGAGDEDGAIHLERHRPRLSSLSITDRNGSARVFIPGVIPYITGRGGPRLMAGGFVGSRHFDILVLPETNLILVASVIEPLRAANRIAGRELYQWTLYSPNG